MGAAESKSHGSSAVNGSERSSKAKLTFMPGADPLLSTPIYTLRDAFYGKRPVSAFTFDPSQFAVDNKQEFLPKAIKKVKTIRHPSVLKFIDCKSSPAGVHLITEQVRPLTTDYLESISEDEILLGLYDILVALHFLHSQCQLSHNNVQLDSIFVANGRWVLGGMEMTGTVAESMEMGLTSMLSTELVPPEYNSRSQSKNLDLPHAVDIWQYGRLIELLSDEGLVNIKPGTLPLELMLSSNPEKRPSGDIILESDFLAKNNAVAVVRYCRLKGLDKAQNQEWHQSIMSRLYMLHPSIVERFVLPQLLTQEFFAAEGFDSLYRTLFTPQPPRPLVSEELYHSHIMPFMVKLWTFRQADIRMTILRLFEVYLKAIVLGQGGTEVLSQIIIPEILAGLQDADPKIYMASLSGLATAIPYALLVTTYVETDVKIKFSIKSLYEQTLIPQIMAFWISEDSSRESRVELIEVVMGMWCSIYTLGLHNHAAVKDLSATLTLTLVSVMKLSSVQERVDLISRSFTKHSTNSLFCVHGLLKFLPQFLLDDEREVREAAARAISMVAQQAVTLASTSAESTIVDQPDSQTSSESEKQQDGGSSSAATSPSSVHASRIRQYCEKQQSLLPPRRSIFSRSTFASERSFSGLNGSSPSGGGSHSAVGSMIGRTNSMTDISSSRRSSMVSQDSFMISEHGSLRTPGAVTPSITRTESFSGEGPSLKEGSEELQALPNQPHATVQARVHAGQEARSNSFSSSNLASNSHRDQSDSAGIQTNTGLEAAGHEDHSESDTVTVEEELMKALEEAKVQMKLRQQQVHGASQSSLSTTSTPKLEAEAVAPVAKVTTVFKAAAFDWDNGDGDDDDGWGEDNLETIDSSTKPQQTVEDEQERKRKEMEMAEKEEQLRLKRDQKQQEMQAKREARRQQLAEKQLQKKATSIATGGIKKLGVSPAASERGLISPVSPSSTSRSPTTLSSTAGVKSTNTVETVASRLARLPIGQFEEENDGWGMDDGLDMSSALEQPTTKPDEDDDLFKDLEVAYKAPTYVKAGASDLGENGNSVRSTPLLGSNASATTLTTDNSSRKDIDNFAKSASQKSVLAVKETATITTGTSLLSSSLTSVTSPAVVSPVSSPGTLPSPRDHSSRNSSQKSSPVSTPLRVASPAPGSVGKGKLSVTSSTSTTTVSETTTITETTTKTSATLREASKSIAPPPSLSTASVSLEPKVTTTPSIALSVDEAALEDDGWGDEWE